MTMLVARPPLHPLPMSSTQRPNRRLSARLQEKEDAPPISVRAQVDGNVVARGTISDSAIVQTSKISNEKKRKMNYDEEDDGFLFKRVKKQKPEEKPAEPRNEPVQVQNKVQKPQVRSNATQALYDDEGPRSQRDPKKKRMSFSTPNPKDAVPVRRSKRLSRDNEEKGDSSGTKQAHNEEQKKQVSPRKKMTSTEESKKEEGGVADPLIKPPEQPNAVPEQDSQQDRGKETIPTHLEGQSATKIALPFADTPVIKRNKAMREGKGSKGERRSSLGLRGRRASSLIESGNSNALPHTEVEIPDFFKHIESEGLPEPRRMRQLLTWCATRALEEKPIGTDFEDSSARSAARVIEEELLKDLANKSELSDWFSREDVPVQQFPLPERPNPKNAQNVEKIAELEEQIQRLRMEKEALESLLRPPNIPSFDELEVPTSFNAPAFDRSLLSEADAAAIDSIAANPTSSEQLSQRLNGLYESLGPTIDAFADGIHKLGRYRDTADGVAGRVLAVCAEKLAQREQEGLKKALPAGKGNTPKDLGGVLRSLSRADR